MRIISQNKQCDIPYEISVIDIVKSKGEYEIDATFTNKDVFILGKYNSLDDAKAVLWAIASNFREGKKYYEMPQADEDLTCIQ